ncbi:hypothetical protein Taro_046253, partial [Colocasia esculenta]|nr:hypothetical protein [Colocasia esculenta]
IVSHLVVYEVFPKQPLGILLTKGTVPLKDNATPSTTAGLLLFPGLSATWWSTSSVSIEESV